MLAHHRPVGTVASEGNLAGFREQAAVGIGDDAQDVIGQPPLEQLEDGSDPARALGPDGLPGDLPELPDAHDDVIEVRSDDHGVDPAGVVVVGQLSEADLAVAVYQFIRQLSFLREHQLDLLLDGTAGHELADEHVAVLAVARTCEGLRKPPR